MVITKFGRVELDPMSVPRAAAMDRGRTGGFAARLAAHRQVAEAPRNDPEPAPVDAPVQTPAAPDAKNDGPRDDAAADDATAPATHDGSDQAAAGPVAATNELPSRGEPARRIETDKGAGPPLESSAASPPRHALLEGALAATISPRSGPLPVATAAAMVAATVSRAPTGPVAERLPGAEGVPALRAAAAKVAATGYRTLTPQSVQLTEQARDSVFKQILFRLGKGGGEMRLRLDPPELGELDLHLVVENGNTLRLSIGTERADLRDLLQNGMPELRQQLQQSGLAVAHAEVHTRQSNRGLADGAPTPPMNGLPDDEDDALAAGTSQPRTGSGWISAQGLDYWA